MLLSDSVPVWIVIGAVTVSGWAYEIATGDSEAQEERERYHDVHIATLESNVDGLEKDITEIKQGIVRIEGYLRDE